MKKHVMLGAFCCSIIFSATTTVEALLNESDQCVFSNHEYKELRKELLELGDKIATSEQIQKFVTLCAETSGDSTPFSLYGVPLNNNPDKILITCRTLIECMNDARTIEVFAEQKQILQNWGSKLSEKSLVVFDPFCGSGNALLGYVLQLSQEIGINCEGIGWDNSPTIVDCTIQSLKNVLPDSYRPLIERHPFESLVTFYDTSLLTKSHILLVSPPWGDAINSEGYLDLGKTHPPVGSIIRQWKEFSKGTKTLYIIQVTKKIVDLSLYSLCETEGLNILSKSSKSILCEDIVRSKDA